MLRIVWALEGRLAGDSDRWVPIGDLLTYYADPNRAKEMAQSASSASGLGQIEWRDGLRNPFLDLREIHGYVAGDEAPAFKVHPRSVDHRIV